MTWLLRLYPQRWRERYGGEVAEMLAGAPFSLAIAIDLIAGAIDVWLHPGVTMAAATAATPGKAEEKTMVTRLLRFDCAPGANVKTADQWKAGGVTLGGTILLTLAWMWLHVRIGDNAYVDTFSVMPFIVPLVFSMRYTYLKERPASVQFVFIAGTIALVAALMLAIGFIFASPNPER
jgi:hypothetical protein